MILQHAYEAIDSLFQFMDLDVDGYRNCRWRRSINVSNNYGHLGLSIFEMCAGF
jgi:hypothetical protein